MAEGVACGNPRHPDGPWHPATPLPASWQWAERLRQWRRRRRYGCGCTVAVDQCRPVTVEVDGEPVTVRVRGEQPMSEEARAAFAEIIAAAKRKHDAEPPRTDLCDQCGFPTRTSLHRRRCGST